MKMPMPISIISHKRLPKVGSERKRKKNKKKKKKEKSKKKENTKNEMAFSLHSKTDYSLSFYPN